MLRSRRPARGSGGCRSSRRSCARPHRRTEPQERSPATFARGQSTTVVAFHVMHVAVTAVGADRPGIVAAVSRVLYDIGGNIEDSRMAILGGHFAMVLIVALPQGA